MFFMLENGMSLGLGIHSYVSVANLDILPLQSKHIAIRMRPLRK